MLPYLKVFLICIKQINLNCHPFSFLLANAFDHKDQALWYGIIGAQSNLKRQSPIELSTYEVSALKLF